MPLTNDWPSPSRYLLCFKPCNLLTATGVRIRARKGAVKAQAKHEPTVFRDQLLKHVASAPPGDYDALYERLVQAGVTLEMLKYADEMFDVLIIGGLLQPGGDLLQDGAPICTFALVLQPGDKEVREGVEAINRLSRRYKYLQKPLEDRALPKLFQYGHKWPADQRDKIRRTFRLMRIAALSATTTEDCPAAPVGEMNEKQQVLESFGTLSLGAKTPLSQSGTVTHHTLSRWEDNAQALPTTSLARAPSSRTRTSSRRSSRVPPQSQTRTSNEQTWQRAGPHMKAKHNVLSLMVT
ncbi:hypothetical protein BKA62DRAFT_837212 [Auriculariales sp. MPI-PUGE-AT-0066]|nr:hypothetical protein BKA62DRAFT_837212 [Auriculariales sp. MPI-PUGE-AT-0066]